jgi:hypothetical protein
MPLANSAANFFCFWAGSEEVNPKSPLEAAVLAVLRDLAKGHVGEDLAPARSRHRGAGGQAKPAEGLKSPDNFPVTIRVM